MSATTYHQISLSESLALSSPNSDTSPSQCVLQNRDRHRDISEPRQNLATSCINPTEYHKTQYPIPSICPSNHPSSLANPRPHPRHLDSRQTSSFEPSTSYQIHTLEFCVRMPTSSLNCLSSLSILPSTRFTTSSSRFSSPLLISATSASCSKSPRFYLVDMSFGHYLRGWPQKLLALERHITINPTP